ncbi:MAG: hypothetical protein KAT41_05545, partial [Candidatus Marinimicrobia bacterium]|nr:hypothetical protein [Candidatus Neomarinimicrobiota bacterium]
EKSTSATSSSTNIIQETRLGVFSSARAYHNFSVKNQLGCEMSFVLIQKKGEIISKENEGQLSLEASQLWTITDRILWGTSLDMTYMFRTYLKDNEEEKPRVAVYELTNRFDYYIENNLKIYIGLALRLHKSKPKDVDILFPNFDSLLSSYYLWEGESKRMSISVGLAYYFDSALR